MDRGGGHCAADRGLSSVEGAMTDDKSGWSPPAWRGYAERVGQWWRRRRLMRQRSVTRLRSRRSSAKLQAVRAAHLCCTVSTAGPFRRDDDFGRASLRWSVGGPDLATSIAAVEVGPSDGARVVQTTAGLAAVQAIGKRHGGRLYSAGVRSRLLHPHQKSIPAGDSFLGSPASMCTDRLAAQSDGSPDAARPQDRRGRPEDFQGSDVLDLGAKKPATAILQHRFS
jgi:hypothetical protein